MITNDIEERSETQCGWRGTAEVNGVDLFFFRNRILHVLSYYGEN